jgi:hypothetical protein
MINRSANAQIKDIKTRGGLQRASIAEVPKCNHPVAASR